MDELTADVEIRPDRGSLMLVDDGRADRVDGLSECRSLCARLEAYWKTRGYKDVKCRPVCKQYRGYLIDGEKFVATYWEVASNIKGTWR